MLHYILEAFHFQTTQINFGINSNQIIKLGKPNQTQL